jgi:hypothetical protein
MKVNEGMSLKRLQSALRKYNDTTKRILEKRNKQFYEISEMISKKIYQASYYYEYEEYTRKKYRRIKKRTWKFKSDDFISDRSIALDYCQHRRRVFEAASDKMKAYNQVLLVCSKTNEKLVIAGRSYYDNMYGLAREAAILPNTVLKIVESDFSTGKVYWKNNRQLYYPGFDANSKDLYGTHYPFLFSSQLDITIGYTTQPNTYSNLNEFYLREIVAYERKIKNETVKEQLNPE